MESWVAKARKDYFCDKCGKKIPKGTRRLVIGYRSLAYTIVDKNICFDCGEVINGQKAN